MENIGWRKPTPELCRADQLAQIGAQVSASKNRSFIAVKKVASAIGAKPCEMVLLDLFGAFTQNQDWEKGQRPIVWPSNKLLMEQTGFSLSALQRHTRKLSVLGLITFKDSQNGKRWGVRDKEGQIVEAYGIDLSPLAARVEEFEGLYEELKRERELCKNLRKQITIARRSIRAKIYQAMDSALSGAWSDLLAQYECGMGKLPKPKDASEKLKNILTWFNNLRNKVEQAYGSAICDDEKYHAEAAIIDNKRCLNHEKVTPNDATDDTHILSTNQLKYINSNVERSVTEKKNQAKAAEKKVCYRKSETSEPDVKETHQYETKVDLPTIIAACPLFAEFARDLSGYIRNWNDLYRLANQIRPMCQIPENVWNNAIHHLGPHASSAAMALIFDKYSNGEIKSPGGYLRGMLGKATNGDLHLYKSIHGRLNKYR